MNDSNYISHASNNCDLFKNEFKKYYAKSKDFNRCFALPHKESNNYNNVCSNCFIPFNICFFLRNKYGENKKMRACIIWEEMAVFYQIVYQQKSNLIPYNFYLTPYREKKFGNYYN